VLPAIILIQELNPYSQENPNKLLWTPMKIVKKHYMNNSSAVDAKLRAMLTQVP
jgi:DNA transposition AAA+ family ATPase